MNYSQVSVSFIHCSYKIFNGYNWNFMLKWYVIFWLPLIRQMEKPNLICAWVRRDILHCGNTGMIRWSVFIDEATISCCFEIWAKCVGFALVCGWSLGVRSLTKWVFHSCSIILWCEHIKHSAICIGCACEKDSVRWDERVRHTHERAKHTKPWWKPIVTIYL